MPFFFFFMAMSSIAQTTCTFADSNWLVYNSAGMPGTADWATTNNTNFIAAAPSTTDGGGGFTNIPGQVTYHNAAGRFPGVTANNLIWNNALGYADSVVFKTSITANACDSVYIRVASDDRIDNVWFNGTNIGTGFAGGGWQIIETIGVPVSLVSQGTNYICIQASDVGGHTAWMLAEVCVVPGSCCADDCFWTLDGNMINGNRNKFGTRNNNGINIISNNTNRGIITNDGKFGWNQMNPLTTFHVGAGQARFDDISGTGNALVETDNLGTLKRKTSGNANQFLNGDGNWTDISTVNYWTKNALNNLYLTPTGNNYVGINVVNPQANVDILNTNCDNKPALKITEDGSVGCLYPNNNGNFMEFYTSGTPTPRFIVTSGGWVGINRIPSYALDVNGTIRANTPLIVSDRRYKNNIQDIKKPMEIINQLYGKTYEFNTKEFPKNNFDEGNQFGFIAQDVQKILPELVKEDNKGYLAVNYTAIIPILSQAIKEQQAQIEELKNMISNHSTGNSPSSTQETEASDLMKGVTLSQNVPNPFTVDTRISYSIPQQFKIAKLGVYDLNGQELKLVNLTSASGDVIIQGGNLKPGMYLYTLIIDGRAAATKKMTLTSN